MDTEETKALLDGLDRPQIHCPCTIGQMLEIRIRALEAAITQAILDLNAAESRRDIEAEIALLRRALEGK